MPKSKNICCIILTVKLVNRSKTFAEKIGIETDWNCAISLRATSGPDAFRMYSTEYGDWDVKARLPHGVEVSNKEMSPRAYHD